MAEIAATSISIYNGSTWVVLTTKKVLFFNGSAWVSAYDGGGVAIAGGDGNFYYCPVFSSAVSSLLLESGSTFEFTCTMNPVGVISVVSKPMWLTVYINGNTVKVSAINSNDAKLGLLRLSCSNGALDIVLDVELLAGGDI